MTYNITRPAPQCASLAAIVLAASIIALTHLPTAAETTLPAEDSRPNAVAFRQMRHGIFITQTYGLTGWPDGRENATLDEFTNAFDVKTFASQMEEMGMEYVVFTAWHKAIYCLGPNQALEKWLPGHTAKRDLIGEIADALHAKGIKLVIYAHPNDGHDLTPDEQAKIGFSNRAEDKGVTLNKFTNEFFAELAARYSKKPNVIGFWWDSWWSNDAPVDMVRLRKTVLEEFPGAITLSNKFDPAFIDFLSIEGGGPPPFEQMTAFKDNLTFFTLGDWWSAGPGSSWYGGRAISPEEMYRFLMLNVGTGAPGGMTWAMSPLADGNTWPGDNAPLEAMKALAKLIEPVRPTICNMLPSHNWVLPSGTRWPTAPAFVASRSPSNKLEFIHVIKPPAQRFIDLPKPTESFSAARMFLCKKPVAMTMEDDHLRLTLPDGETWSDLDTVIELAIDR
jgi:hypothetical protein